MCGQAVAPRAADLLIIALDAFRQIEMNDEAHVRFIDAHTKGDGRHDDLRIITNEGFLIPSAV